MLTKKQIDSIPKGSFSNIVLAKNFKTHGKKHRETIIPVDRFGNFTTDLKKQYAVKSVRLNRREIKRFSSK